MLKKTLLFLTIALAFASAGQNWLLAEEAFDNVSIQPSDLEGWTFDKILNNNEITYCGELSLVGGYSSTGGGATLSKTFTNFPEHYKAKVVVTVFFIDSWDNEYFTIKANGAEVLREQSHLSWHSTALCGVAGWGERVATLEVEFAHSFGDLTIEFGSTLNENANNESWGVRDFQIFLDRCDDGCEVLTEEFQGDFTNADVSGWVGSREVAEPVTECEGHKVLGGFGKFGQKFNYSKTYEGLQEHYKVVIAFRLWMIDSWDGNESFRVALDGKSAFSQLKTMGAGGGQYQCGNGAWKDQAIDVTIEVPHTGSTLEVALEDSLNEAANNESWGISNWRIYTLACEGDCQTVAQELGQDSFNADDIQGWSDKDGNAYDVAQACARTSVVGGYNALAGNTLSKTYTDLPAHTKIMFAIEVYFIDSWDNENFTITIDDVPGITTTKGKGDWAFNNGNQCGNGGADEIQLLWVELPHFSDSAEVKLISELNQAATDESWGFREVNVYVANEAPGAEVDSEFTDNDFTEVAEGWTVENPVGEGRITECAGQQIVGGHNTFSGKTKVSRTFTDLPAHDFIEVYFKAYFIDSWDKEAFVLQIDGEKRKQLTKLSLAGLDSQALCGEGRWEDSIYFVQARFQHSGSEALVEIFTMLDQAANDESWGFKDFHFFVGNNDLMRPDCPTLYTECGFEGDSFNLCENTPDFSEVDWTQQVHSVWVPEGWTATLYSETDYDGESHVFTEPAECLENGPNFTLIRINSNENNIKKHNLAQVNHLKINKKAHNNKHSKVSHLRKNAHKL